MILYDDNYNVVGIDDKSLNILGYDSVEKFKSTDMDISGHFIKKEGYVYDTDFCSWLDYVIYSGEKGKALISSAKGELFQSDIEVDEIYSLNDDEKRYLYGIDFTGVKKIDNEDVQVEEREEKSNVIKNRYGFVVDLDELGMDEEFYSKLLDEFFIENDRYVSKIESYIEDAKFDKIKNIVSILESICTNLKLDYFLNSLKSIEDSVAKRDEEALKRGLKSYIGSVEDYKSRL